MQKEKKYPNFQDLYSFSDYKTATNAFSTFNCGLSPICLLAPNQHYEIHKSILKEDSASALVNIRTLKLEYAIKVWLKAALISADNPGPLLYYWWLGYDDNETSFRELKYHKFYCDATPEDMIDGFWKLLEKIANSGEIKVNEGFSYRNKPNYANPHVCFDVVIDAEDAKKAENGITDLFSYPFNQTPKTYTWEEIKQMFTQLTLKQLSLQDLKQLHKHNVIDEILFTACCELDLDAVKTAIRMGANVNALNENGQSALQRAIEFFTDHGKVLNVEYSEEETKVIEESNFKKCVEIVDYLLDLGADIDLYGVDGLQPLVCAYYAHNLDMVKHLLEKGSNPNYNSFRSSDLHSHEEDACNCTVLDLINDCMAEDYTDYEKDVEMLIHQYGGRRLSWDLDEERQVHIGKYYLLMSPCNDKYMFFDNDEWGVGNESEVVVENAEGVQSTISVKEIDGLLEWHQEYLQNINNEEHDWDSWNKRGYELARKVAKIMPNDVALFYPYGETLERKFDNWSNRYYLDGPDEKIRI